MPNSTPVPDHGSKRYRVVRLFPAPILIHAEFETPAGATFYHPVVLWALVEDEAGQRRIDSLTTRGVSAAEGFTSEQVNFQRYIDRLPEAEQPEPHSAAA